MHDQHQSFFDQVAAEWDLMFTAEDLERLQHLVEGIGVGKGMDILDLGCGTGILFDLLRRKVGDKGTVTGVDFSLKMAQTAHRNFPFSSVNVVDADVGMLPFRDQRFDMAVAFASFPHFADQQTALHEAHRVLKSSARLYIIHLLSSKQLAEMHYRTGGAVAHDELPTRERLQTMFAASHFDDVRIEDNRNLYLASAMNSR